MWYMATLKDTGRGYKGKERKKLIEEQIDRLLAEVELSDVKTSLVGSLSGGMKQRLALAQAVTGDPSILILDEPTAGLDPKQRISIRNYISRIAFNKIVIIATHVVSDVEFIAREAIMLKKGVISDSGSPYELTQKIEGQVWQTVVKPEDVQAMQEKFRVVNIQNGEQGVILRILSDVQPTEDSVTVVPSLEDYYLHVFGDIL
jgi:ABC-type multidrug transport system ATPase subunit